MGMFDYVNACVRCNKCGASVGGADERSAFQTKDRACKMEWLQPRDVNNFYTHCPGCGVWVEFFRPAHYSAEAAGEPATLAEITELGFRESDRLHR